MKFQKLILTGVVLLWAALVVLSSCSKKKDDAPAITKEQLIGKWEMSVQANNYIDVWKAELTAAGVMKVDVPPYTGISDYIFLWNLAGNKFTAQFAANNIPNYLELTADVDPGTLSMSGLVRLNDPNTLQTCVFTMDKQ